MPCSAAFIFVFVALSVLFFLPTATHVVTTARPVCDMVMPCLAAGTTKPKVKPKVSLRANS